MYFDLLQIEHVFHNLFNKRMFYNFKRNEFTHWYEITNLTKNEVVLLESELNRLCNNYTVSDTYGNLDKIQHKIKIYNINIESV